MGIARPLRLAPLRRARRGHTLFEIITVLAVSAILSGLGITSLVWVSQQQDVHRDTRRVRSALVEARSLARASQRCVQVILGAHQLELTPYEICEPKLADPGPTWTRELVEEVSLEGFSHGSTTLLFNEDGGLDLDGPVELDVASRQGTVTYRIYPAIGTVRRVDR